MKMPSINIAFKEKGISAVERSERGIVLLILKEETLPSQTEVNLYTADDIPKELSDSNREQLELTLRGYVNSPKKVIAEIISKDAEDYTCYDMTTSDYRGIMFNFGNDYWTENPPC